MMKLKHLFGNEDLAQMLFRNWTVGQGEEVAVRHFRSSANAVYTCSLDAATYFLRITPCEEKSPTAIAAELDFLSYLRERNDPAVRSVPAANGEAFVTADTPWGRYSMVVFEKVPGRPMDRMPYSDRIYEGYGQSLARLHRLSQRYEPPKALRSDWRETLIWCRRAAAECGDPPRVLREADLLERFLDALPRTRDDYGLIHYDFELDNVFYDEAGAVFTPIDFDDAMYHWYALDVWQTTDSIREELPAEYRERAVSSFLAGYQSLMPLTQQMMAAMPAFGRFVALYGYVRCLRSLQEQWAHEPAWMAGLRQHLRRMMALREAHFGEPLSR